MLVVPEHNPLLTWFDRCIVLGNLCKKSLSYVRTTVTDATKELSAVTPVVARQIQFILSSKSEASSFNQFGGVKSQSTRNTWSRRICWVFSLLYCWWSCNTVTFLVRIRCKPKQWNYVKSWKNFDLFTDILALILSRSQLQGEQRKTFECLRNATERAMMLASFWTEANKNQSCSAIKLESNTASLSKVSANPDATKRRLLVLPTKRLAKWRRLRKTGSTNYRRLVSPVQSTFSGFWSLRSCVFEKGRKQKSQRARCWIAAWI